MRVIVKGLFQSAIAYAVNIIDGDWSPYFTFRQQSFGQFDTDSCWMLSSINCAEAQLNWFWANNMFSPEAMSFFMSNGYVVNGIFSLSERFHEILCGNEDNGGEATEAWQSFQKRGFIPRLMLTYTSEQAAQWTTQMQFVADYFDPDAVTGVMEALGQLSLKYINIAYQRIGTLGQTPNIQVLRAAFKQAPPNYGIPVNDSEWNQTDVPADTDTTIVHEVAGRVINPDGSYGIYDQYEPPVKNLAAGYYIGACLQGVITPIPAILSSVPQPTGEENDSFWSAVMQWWNGIFSNAIPIGSA